MKLYLEIANKITKECSADSVFLYGSVARGESLENSDAEIGVIFSNDKYQKRKDLQEKYGDNNISIFPFKKEDLLNGTPDTPFQKSLYIRDLVSSARTLAGEKIIENLNLSEIRVLDLIQEVRFNLGYALAATHSQRNGDEKTAALHFSKSCLYGARDLIIIEKRIFPKTYKEILAGIISCSIPEEYKILVQEAMRAREEGKVADSSLLFKNISFLNIVVEKKLLDFFNKEGNKVVVA